MEGLRLTEYRCTAGRRTIGYGTTDFPLNVYQIDLQTAETWMQRDADKCVETISKICPNIAQDEVRMAACVSFAYNLGINAFATSTMVKHIKKSEWVDAAKECLKWCHERHDGQLSVNTGLLSRRKIEAHMLEAGQV
jgi:lysozyme